MSQEASGKALPVAVVTGANRGIGRAIAVGYAKAGYASPPPRGTRPLSATPSPRSRAPTVSPSPFPATSPTRRRWRPWPSPCWSISAPCTPWWPTRASAAPPPRCTRSSSRPGGSAWPPTSTACSSRSARHPGAHHRGRGSLVAIWSMTGKRPLYGRTPYAASKMAVIGLVRTLALELGPHGIRVNAICPGAVRPPPDGGAEQPGRARGITFEEGPRRVHGRVTAGQGRRGRRHRARLHLPVVRSRGVDHR